MTRKLRGIFGIVMVGTVALAGCGGVATTEDTAPDGKPTGDIIVGATQAAESARLSLTWDTEWDEDTATAHDATVLEGVIDFAADRGSMKDVTPPPPPTTAPPTSDGSTSLSVSTTSGRGSEYRWIGSMSYSHSPHPELGFGTPTKPWVAVDQATLADATECPYDNGSTTAMLGAGGSATTLLDDLRADGSRLTEGEKEKVRGVETTRWRVQLPETPSDPRCDSERIESKVVEYSVWTDDDGRARRIKRAVTMTFRGDDDFPDDTTTTTVTTEFFDFGVPVTVEAPPADQVTDLTDSWAMTMRGQGKVDNDSWTRAATGSSNGERWTIWFAETSTGWRCYDVENPPDDLGGILNDGDPDVPKHDGRSADCRPSAGGPMFGDAFNVFITEATGINRVRMYGSVGGGGTARVRFPDGAEEQLRPDPKTHIAIWEGPTPKERTYVELDDGSKCRLDNGSTSFDDSDDFETPCGSLTSAPVPTP